VENRRGGRSAPITVNSSVRTREYLTTAEIERLMAAARKSSPYGHRDATMILIGYRHGLRASELCDLQWSQVELAVLLRAIAIRHDRRKTSTGGSINSDRNSLARIRHTRTPREPRESAFGADCQIRSTSSLQKTRLFEYWLATSLPVAIYHPCTGTRRMNERFIATAAPLCVRHATLVLC